MRGVAVVLLRAGVVLFVWAPLSYAAMHPDNGPGCGLGKMAWAETKHPHNIAPQVLMSTTNQIGLQSIAISFGTWGCTNDGTVMADKKTALFAAMNLENLSQEMAQGGGEHLASLATLLGVPAEQQPEFFAMAQERYQAFTEAGQASPVALLHALHEAMAAHPVLAKVSTLRTKEARVSSAQATTAASVSEMFGARSR